MNRCEARAVVDLLGNGVASGPHGITWGPLRVYCGGGIAGHSDQWWIDFPGEPSMPVLGPFRTLAQLRRAIRCFVVRNCKVLAAIGEALGPLQTPGKE